MISSIILFGVFIIIYSMLIEVFTVLFQLTGITREKARTQVISLLTNCGFTTSVSEIMMSSKRRRSLARGTMICGYSFSVIIVSVLVNIFLKMNDTQAEHMLGTLGIMGFVFFLYVLMTRIRKIRQLFSKMIEKLGNRLMFGKDSNPLILIDIVREKAMVEVMVDHVPASIKDSRLSKSNLVEKYHIQVLYVRRKGKSMPINGSTEIMPGDVLLLFGDYKKIRDVFEKPQIKNFNKVEKCADAKGGSPMI